MTITPHLLTGAALGSIASNYPLAILMGLFSHFILDAVPHLDPGTLHNERPAGYTKEVDLAKVHENDKPWPLWIYVFAIAEFIVAWALVYILYCGRSNFGLIAAGALAGILVDILDNPLFSFTLNWPIIKQIHYLHHRFHYDLPKAKWYWGALTEIIIIGGSLWFLSKSF